MDGLDGVVAREKGYVFTYDFATFTFYLQFVYIFLKLIWVIGK